MVFALSKEGHELGGEGLIQLGRGADREHQERGLIWQQYSPFAICTGFYYGFIFCWFTMDIFLLSHSAVMDVAGPRCDRT
jgi:hypothetical protein